MVHVVSSANRAGFVPQINQMHRDRKRVFVDRLKWDVPVVDGQYEIVQFDGNNAAYLIETNPQTAGRWASLRLLPSTIPHLPNDMFPTLRDGPPDGDDVMELTCFCVSTGKHPTMDAFFVETHGCFVTRASVPRNSEKRS